MPDASKKEGCREWLSNSCSGDDGIIRPRGFGAVVVVVGFDREGDVFEIAVAFNVKEYRNKFVFSWLKDGEWVVAEVDSSETNPYPSLKLDEQKTKDLIKWLQDSL